MDGIYSLLQSGSFCHTRQAGRLGRRKWVETWWWHPTPSWVKEREREREWRWPTTNINKSWNSHGKPKYVVVRSRKGGTEAQLWNALWGFSTPPYKHLGRSGISPSATATATTTTTFPFHCPDLSSLLYTLWVKSSHMPVDSESTWRSASRKPWMASQDTNNSSQSLLLTSNKLFDPSISMVFHLDIKGLGFLLKPLLENILTSNRLTPLL